MINRPPNFASKRRTGWKVFWSFFQSLVALSIILAILSTWYSQAWSTELSAQTTSFLQFRAEDYENQVTHRIPFCQYLNIYGMDLAGAQGLSIAIGGWGMYDLYQWRTKDRADGDLNFGYLDYQFFDGVSLRRVGNLSTKGLPWSNRLMDCGCKLTAWAVLDSACLAEMFHRPDSITATNLARMITWPVDVFTTGCWT